MVIQFGDKIQNSPTVKENNKNSWDNMDFEVLI